MNKTVVSIVSTLIFCFWNSGDLRAEETNGKGLPPIQLVAGDKSFIAANQERVDLVRQIPGLVALWDFVQRRDSWKTRNPFISIPGKSSGRAYELEPRNISRDFWHEGPQATLADFELFGRGPISPGYVRLNRANKHGVPGERRGLG